MECSWGLDRSEAIHRYTLISVAIAEAAALDDEVIDCIVCEMLRLCVQVVSLTRAGLSLEQLHAEVGDLQLLLNFGTVRVFYVVRWWQSSENNLQGEEHHVYTGCVCASPGLFASCSPSLIYASGYLHDKITWGFQTLLTPGEEPPCYSKEQVYLLLGYRSTQWVTSRDDSGHAEVMGKSILSRRNSKLQGFVAEPSLTDFRKNSRSGTVANRSEARRLHEPRVQDQPGQHGETPCQTQTKRRRSIWLETIEQGKGGWKE